MADSFRRHRLELPGVPKVQDPAVQKYLTDIRRLTMDEVNRIAGDFFAFKEQVIAGIGFTLAPVAAIALSAVTSSTATFTWVLPSQPEVIPTHVRVRIAEFGDSWAEFDYPLTTWTAYFLLPDTEYTFQIQLVFRGETTIEYVSAVRNCPTLPVSVESVSEIRSYSFTTQPGVGPPGDGGGGDTDFPIPDTDGPPGAPGGDDCWWEWKIQIADGSDGTWSDTALDGSVDGDVGDIIVDLSSLDPGRMYRLCILEVCDGVPDPDGYQCGDPFPGDPDWGADCGGALASDSWVIPPNDTADLYVMPEVCLVDGEGLFVRDKLSEQEILRDTGYLNVTRADGDWSLLTKSVFGTVTAPVGWILLTTLIGLNNADDISLALRFKPTNIPASGGLTVLNPIFSWGPSRIIVSCRSDGTGWGFRLAAGRETGGTLIIDTPMDLDPDAFGKFLFTSDNDGDKVVYVNDHAIVTDTSGNELRLDGMDGTVRIQGFPSSQIQGMYGWSRSLSSPEIFPDMEFIGYFVSYDVSAPLPKTINWLPGDYVLIQAFGISGGSINLPDWIARIDGGAATDNPATYGGFITDGFEFINIQFYDGGIYQGVDAMDGNPNAAIVTGVVLRNLDISPIASFVRDSLDGGTSQIGPVDIADGTLAVLLGNVNEDIASEYLFTETEIVSDEWGGAFVNRSTRIYTQDGPDPAYSFQWDGAGARSQANHFSAVSFNLGGQSYFPGAGISYVGAGTDASASAGTTLTPGLPSGLVAGDLLVYIYHTNDNSGFGHSTPSGFVEFGCRYQTARDIHVYLKWAVGGDATLITENSAGIGRQGKVFAYRGVQAWHGMDTQPATTLTPIDTPCDNVVALAAAAGDFWQPLSVATPNGYTTRGIVNLASWGGVGLAEKVFAAEGPADFPVFAQVGGSAISTALVYLIP